MTVNLAVEFNREKYNRNYKSHIYKIKPMTYTSTNTHVKKFIRFQIINQHTHFQISASNCRVSSGINDKFYEW